LSVDTIRRAENMSARLDNNT